MIFIFLFISAVISTVSSSYCGEAAIPYTFQALSNGQPVLGCARPSCFGWNANGETAGDSARFYRIQKKNDGYLRDGDSEKKNFVKYVFYKSQTSQCEKGYNSVSCDKTNQWAGGIAPSANVSQDPLLLKCCDYNGLALSIDRGVAEVKPGQIMVGGEVISRKRQYAFDYISNIQKNVKPNGEITYSVAMRRFPCLSPLNEPDIKVEERVSSIVANMDGWLKNKQKEREKDTVKKHSKLEKVTEASPVKKQETPQKDAKKDEENTDEDAEDEKIMKLLEEERNAEGDVKETSSDEDETSSQSQTSSQNEASSQVPIPMQASGMTMEASQQITAAKQQLPMQQPTMLAAGSPVTTQNSIFLKPLPVLQQQKNNEEIVIEEKSKPAAYELALKSTQQKQQVSPNNLYFSSSHVNEQGKILPYSDIYEAETNPQQHPVPIQALYKTPPPVQNLNQPSPARLLLPIQQSAHNAHQRLPTQNLFQNQQLQFANLHTPTKLQDPIPQTQTLSGIPSPDLLPPTLSQVPQPSGFVPQTANPLSQQPLGPPLQQSVLQPNQIQHPNHLMQPQQGNLFASLPTLPTLAPLPGIFSPLEFTPSPLFQLPRLQK